jgi:hypothetical protein
MSAFVRSTGAVGLMFAMACGSVAATNTLEANYISADWQEECSLPSVTAGSAVMHDEQVTPVSDDEAAEKSSSCDSCNSGDSCEPCMTSCCDPTCFAMVGAVILHRSRPDSAVIATPPTGTPGTLINASDLDNFGWDNGVDATIGKRLSNGLIVEGRFFNDESAQADSDIPAVTTFRIAGIGVTILGGGGLHETYNTDMDSSELNVGTALTPGCTFFTGFRWIELHDQLRVNLVGTGLNIASWDENNHLYGGQMGTHIRFTNASSPFQFTGTLKAGAYGDVADNSFTSQIVSRASDSDTSLAFVGEVQFMANYRLTQHVGLYGGYQVMWIDDVAIAGDQAATTVQAVGGTRSPINTDGRVVYDGVLTGVSYVW